MRASPSSIESHGRKRLAETAWLLASLSLVAGLLTCVPRTAQAEAASSAGESEAFLASAWTDSAVTLRAENLKTFGDASLSNPIEKLQLRLNQNEYIEDRKAVLRASPRGLSEYRLMRQLNGQTARLEDLTFRQGLTKALVERYEALIEYRFAVEARRIESALLQNAKRALSMQSASASNSKASAHDLLKAREAVQGSDFKLTEAEARVRRLAERLKSLAPSLKTETISFSDWPTPTELSGVVDRYSGGASEARASANLETQLAKEHARRMRDSVEYDIQRDTKLIDYVEISYSERATQESRYGFEIGINIPGFSGKDFGNQEKARQLVRYEIEAREKEREQQLLFHGARESLARSVEAYKSATSQEDSATEERIRSLARNADPLLANAIDHESLSRELRANESAREAYRSYVGLLRAVGAFDEKARINFLSRGLKEIRL